MPKHNQHRGECGDGLIGGGLRKTHFSFSHIFRSSTIQEKRKVDLCRSCVIIDETAIEDIVIVAFNAPVAAVDSLLNSLVQFHPVDVYRAKILSLKIDLLNFTICLQRNQFVLDDFLAVVDLDQ